MITILFFLLATTMGIAAGPVNEFVFSIPSLTVTKSELYESTKSGLFEISCSAGKATRSFDPDKREHSLLSNLGLIDFGVFAQEDIRTLQDTTANVFGNRYSSNIWNTKTKTSALQADLNNLQTSPSSPAQLALAGQLDFLQTNLNAKVFFDQGLFARINIPIQTFRLKHQTFVDPSNNSSQLANLVNEKFDAVLIENEFEPLSLEQKHQGLGAINCGIGWSHWSSFFDEPQLIKNFYFEMEAGLVLPASLGQTASKKYFLPLCMNNAGHLGAYGQAAAELKFSNNLITGFNVTTQSFLTRTQQQQTKHSYKQDWFNFHNTTSVHKDVGSSWQVNGYIRGKLAMIGTDLLIGGSYFHQEAGSLKLNTSNPVTFLDANELKNNHTSKDPQPTTILQLSEIDRMERNSKQIVSSDMIKTDPRLKSWHAWTLHLGIVIAPEISMDPIDRPHCKIIYSIPIAGKHAFISKNLSISIGIPFGLNFL